VAPASTRSCAGRDPVEREDGADRDRQPAVGGRGGQVGGRVPLRLGREAVAAKQAQRPVVEEHRTLPDVPAGTLQGGDPDAPGAGRPATGATACL
jgi:hypothetical protein